LVVARQGIGERSRSGTLLRRYRGPMRRPRKMLSRERKISGGRVKKKSSEGSRKKSGGLSVLVCRNDGEKASGTAKLPANLSHSEKKKRVQIRKEKVQIGKARLSDIKVIRGILGGANNTDSLKMRGDVSKKMRIQGGDQDLNFKGQGRREVPHHVKHGRDFSALKK